MFKIIGGDGNEYGPVSAEVLRQWLTQGRVNASTRIRREGAEWTTLGKLSEFSATTPGASVALGQAPASGSGISLKLINEPVAEEAPVRRRFDTDDYQLNYDTIKNPDVEFYLHYSVSNKLKYIVFFPVFSLFMLCFVLILFLPLLKQFFGGSLPLNFTLVDFFNILIPQTIVLFPYTYYYVDSRRRNFEVPFNRITEYSILAALSILLINIILLSSNYLNPVDVLHYIVNNL